MKDQYLDNSDVSSPKGFFSVEQRGGRWTFVDPSGNPFVSIGLNHAEESNLKYPHNIDIWQKRYGSTEAWIRNGALADFHDWGFNTMGWTSEVVAANFTDIDWFGEPVDMIHSPGWTAPQLKSTDMPYVVALPVAEIQDWRGVPVFPDVFSKDFEHWCAYLARSICHEHADSRNLLGYFFVDIPSWVPHTSGRFFPGFEGLSGPQYDQKLYEVASKYYSTIVENIRLIDKNHLVLGDRFNGNKAMPVPVLEAMKPYVDVLSVQYFNAPTSESRAEMVRTLGEAHAVSGKPVLNADLGNWMATELNPQRASSFNSHAERGQDYVDSIGAMLENDWFVGWHWCSYLENTARGWGLKDPWDEPYTDMVNHVRDFNKTVVEAWPDRRATS